MEKIISRDELVALARRLGVRADWHKPDDRGVAAQVEGDCFDDTGFWPTEDWSYSTPESVEMHVIISKNGEDVAAVNLATLLAWASWPGDDANVVTVRTSSERYTDDVESFWRAKIAEEIRQQAVKLRWECDTSSVGNALASIVDSVADKIDTTSR